MSGETVVVIKPGIYADPDFRALPFAEAGETITVAGGWYAESLIADGMAARPVIEPEPTQEDPPVIEPAAAPEPTKRGKK